MLYHQVELGREVRLCVCVCHLIVCVSICLYVCHPQVYKQMKNPVNSKKDHNIGMV